MLIQRFYFHAHFGFYQSPLWPDSCHICTRNAQVSMKSAWMGRMSARHTPPITQRACWYVTAMAGFNATQPPMSDGTSALLDMAPQWDEGRVGAVGACETESARHGSLTRRLLSQVRLLWVSGWEKTACWPKLPRVLWSWVLCRLHRKQSRD